MALKRGKKFALILARLTAASSGSSARAEPRSKSGKLDVGPCAYGALTLFRFMSVRDQTGHIESREKSTLEASCMLEFRIEPANYHVGTASLEGRPPCGGVPFGLRIDNVFFCFAILCGEKGFNATARNIAAGCIFRHER